MDILNTVVSICAILCVIVYFVVKAIRLIKGTDKDAWESQLKFAATLIEKGVTIPKDILVKLLRNELTDKEFADKVVTLSKKQK